MHLILPLLPLLAFFLAWRGRWRQNGDLREAFLEAALFWGTFSLVLSECLSAWQAIRPSNLMFGWLLACLGLILKFRNSSKAGSARSWKRPSNEVLLLCLGVAATLSLAVLIGLFSAPNNRDALLYHLPRVEQWLQNHSLGHFPTGYPLQDYYPPGAEMIILQFHGLSLSDRFDSLIQLFSLLGCCVAASKIVAHWGGSTIAQAGAALLAATLPMAALQASTPQNDLVVSFWLILSSYFVLKYSKDSDNASLFMAAFGMGLALATKGTAYPFGAPLGLWLGILLFQKRPWRQALLAVPWVVLAAFGPALPNLYRNFMGCQNFMGSSIEHMNARLGLGVTCSGLLRNLAAHFTFPSASLDDWLMGLVIKAHHILRIPLNDPATTWPICHFGMYGPLAGRSSDEDVVGNPWHLVLIFLVLWAWFRGRLKTAPSLGYAVSSLAGIILYCSVLRWNPWSSRTQTPFFMMMSPFLGLGFESISRQGWRLALALTLFSVCLSFELTEIHKPLYGPDSIFTMPRQEQYFTTVKTGENSRDAAAWISGRGYQSLGLAFRDFYLEYPLWAWLRNSNSLPQMQHILVTNETAGLEDREPYKDFDPDAILQADPLRRGNSVLLKFKGKTYKEVWAGQGFRVLEKRR